MRSRSKTLKLCGLVFFVSLMNMSRTLADDNKQVHAVWRGRPQQPPKESLAVEEPLVCFSVRDAGRIARAQADLEKTEKDLRAALAEMEALRLRERPLFGWSAGCGGGVGYDLSQQRVEVVPVCAVVWGLRF